jgi:hypothetical protein
MDRPAGELGHLAGRARCRDVRGVMFGVFGNGWLADETVSDPSQALTVDHNRIVRKHLPTELKVTIQNPPAEVELWVSDALLHRVEISSIVPEPSEATAGPDGVTYLFNADDGSNSVDILFQWEYQRMGVIDASIGIVDGPFVDFSEIVLP